MSRSGRTGGQVATFCMVTMQDLPEEWQHPGSNILDNLASAMQVPRAQLRTAVFFIGPDEDNGRRYQAWVTGRNTVQAINILLYPVEEFRRRYGEAELRGFRLSMTINGFPCSTVRVAWNSATSSGPS